MRKVLWAMLFVATLLTTLPGYAQNPNYNYGPVWRVTYYELKPGQGEAFWKDFRENLKPTYENLEEGRLDQRLQSLDKRDDGWPERLGRCRGVDGRELRRHRSA